MKHVLVLNQFAVPRHVAGGTRHLELFSRLDGWTSRIIAGRTTLSGEQFRSDDAFIAVPVTPYRGNGIDRMLNWASYSTLAVMCGVFRWERPDVVYGSSPQLGAALAALIVAKARRAAFVFEVRDLWPQILVEAGSLSESSGVYRVLKRLEMGLYRQADRIVVLAEGSQRALVAQGIPSEKIVFIPNGADREDFVTETPRHELRRRYGFERFTMVYAGAHGPANGLGLVLDAAEELMRSDAQIDFCLVGDGVSKSALIADAEARGLTNVRFLPPVAKSEVPDVLAAADGGLHCLADVELFKSGVSPNKLYDYMAAGLPVLTNTGGDVAAMVNGADSGLAVSPTGIAAGALSLATSAADELSRMARSGQSYMERERSRSAMANRLTVLLNALA